MGLFWRKKKKVQVIGQSWEVYAYTYNEDQVAIISFDLELAQEETHKGYSQCRRVLFFFDPSRIYENGMPVEEDLELHKQIEDDLTGLLTRKGIDCQFVGRMTYGGLREYVFQVEDSRGFDALVPGWLKTVTAFRSEVRQKEGWDFFDEKVCPDRSGWQQIFDRRVVEGLIEAGSNPELPHDLEHCFVGPVDRLQNIAQKLGEHGFKQVSFEGDTLVLSYQQVLDPVDISELTSSLAEIAEGAGVSYDGWGAMVRTG